MEELEQRIQKLEKQIADLSNPATMSDEFIKALVNKGFLRNVGPNVLTYTNPSGREFWSSFFEFKDNFTLINLDNFVSTTGVKATSYIEFTANSSNDTLTAIKHGLSDGQDVRVYTTGNIPGGLNTTAIYYVRDATTDTFKLTTTPGDAAINITSNGGPYNYIVYV